MMTIIMVTHGVFVKPPVSASESIVSRDERNEYHGLTVERAQKILDALNETVTARVEEPAARARALAGAA
jgi:hypothetical protein